MIRVHHVELKTLQLRTRIPFKYGIATMTDVPLLFLCLQADIHGKAASGLSSDCLPPKWFTKIPEKPLDEEIKEMLEVISNAAKISQTVKELNVYSFWRELYLGQQGWAARKDIPPLLAHFGTSLIERALIDAWCRHTGETFHQALRSNAFGLKLADLDSDCSGIHLPSTSLHRVVVRHTIGLCDAITDDDIPEGERVDDGLPQSLAGAIAVYGLKHFKIKVSGNLSQDVPRLHGISTLLGQTAVDFRFSLDGNEQFKSLPQFKEYWMELLREDGFREFFQHLLFVEQPLHRNMALRNELEASFRNWPEGPPIIIDESDGALEDGRRALNLGYAGTSHKNCKGVFKGVLNAARIQRAKADFPERHWILSGEDLCNVGPVALLQDLAVMAALGIESVERNGHHYHCGLSQLPKNLQDHTLQAHGDLYERSPQGWPSLRILNGEMNLGSVNRSPFGYRGEIIDQLGFAEGQNAYFTNRVIGPI